MKRNTAIPAPPGEEVHAALQEKRQGWLEETRQYRFITPLWGGGVTANEVDEVTPVSGKGIRGQLRFWWRATRGGRYGTLQELRAAEDALWGAPANDDQINRDGKGNKKKEASQQVQIEVSVEKGKEGVTVGPNDLPREIYYLTFPLDPDDKTVGTEFEIRYPNAYSFSDGERKRLRNEVRAQLREENFKRALRQDVEFTLNLRFPAEHRTDVEATLWAWETFGGYGARTRRGFGAVERTDSKADKPLNSQPETVQSWLFGDEEQEGKLPTHVFHTSAKDWPKTSNDVPRLPSKHSALKVKFSHGNSWAVWSSLIGNLRDFRQGFRPKKKVTVRPPGKPSYTRTEIGQTDWPDADSVRIKTGDYDPAVHPPRIHHGNFPRAAFGLPIIFHFKAGKGDPQDTSLQAADYERLSSRLILRPLSCHEGYIGLALVLEAPDEPPGGLLLKSVRSTYTWSTGGNSASVEQHLNATEANQAPPGRSAPLNGNPDVLQAFLDFLK
jgi:CRISPR-associated protein Cmr1